MKSPHSLHDCSESWHLSVGSTPNVEHSPHAAFGGHRQHRPAGPAESEGTASALPMASPTICFEGPPSPAFLKWSRNKNQTGDEPRKQDQGSPRLSEEVPYQITLIRLSQGSLDRRREKVIWEMFTENDCNTFADLKGKS